MAATYSFRAPDRGERYGVAVRFVGVRTGIDGAAGREDHFERVERLDGLVADGGPVSISTRATGVPPGDWRVVAEPVEASGALVGHQLPRRVIDTSAQFSELAQGPGVRVVAWPVLVALGAVLAVVLQGVLAARAGMPVGAVVLLSFVSCLVGFLAGKVWYLRLHRRPLSSILNSGACIQGFLLGALAVLGLGALVLGLNVGTVMDVTTPGIFLGVAVGRPGCFLTGCCAGRPTGSAWAVVSSDRRLRVRRFPVQLLEAGVGLVIGLASLAMVLFAPPSVPGALFVAAIAAYVMARQLLFPLRVESRTLRGRIITLGLGGIVLAGALVAMVW